MKESFHSQCEWNSGKGFLILIPNVYLTNKMDCQKLESNPKQMWKKQILSKKNDKNTNIYGISSFSNKRNDETDVTARWGAPPSGYLRVPPTLAARRWRRTAAPLTCNFSTYTSYHLSKWKKRNQKKTATSDLVLCLLHVCFCHCFRFCGHFGKPLPVEKDLFQ